MQSKAKAKAETRHERAASAARSSPYVREWMGMARDLAGLWRDVLQSKSVTSDVLAGLTVAAVALPLNVALAVASGLPPIAGLIGGALGGFIAAAFGGSALQATGPAAALSVMVLALATEFGPAGVAAACIIIGIVQLGLSLGGAGKLAQYVPESVLAGFTTGVGLKLLDGQIPEMLGFDYKVVELAQMMHRPAWLHQVSWLAAVCGLFVAFLVVTTSKYKRFPAAIVGVGLISFVATYVGWNIERVGEIPSTFPAPSLPILADERWLDLILKTMPLALLAAVESLLSARAVDRMAKLPKEHNPNLELFGQGLANLGVGFMGGMPVTGVVVRSGVNVQSGGKTKLSAMLHAVALAASVLFLSQHIARVPLAALAGLLCVIGFRLIEVKTLVHLAKTERVEAIAFVVTCAGTVSGHLMTGLVAGLALHFVNRFMHRHQDAEKQQLASNKADGIRAVLKRDQAEARRPAHLEARPQHHNWLVQIRERAEVAKSAFVHGKASVIGRVVLGEHVHIAAGSSVRADEGSPFFIGANTNIQDGVVIHALKEKRVRVAGEEWAVYVGKNVSLAHDALVHGPCYIGDNTFVGFKAVVHDSVVGSHCFIGIGAIVVGVEIPDGRHVPHGQIVDSADAVAALPHVSDVHTEFNEDVVEVNRGLAVAYRAHEQRSDARSRAKAMPDKPFAAWDARWQPTLDKDRF